MKTFKEIDIKYYDNSGNVQVRCTVPVTQEASVHYELMQSHYCKLSFNLSRPTYFLRGDFIETPYGRFELIDLTKAKDNDTIGYSYEIQFDAYYRKLKNKILKYRPNTGSQESTFSLTSKISTHIEVIMKNLAYYAKLDKSYLYDPNFEGEGTDYTYVIDASVDANAAKLITYSNTSILDAIANIAQTFGCEWWFEGNILHFGTCENTNAITDFRLNDNIVSMSSSQSQSTYANRVYAFGAARNLPSGYKNDADADITKDGVVEKRLMLPNSAECSDKNKQLLAENGFELKNGYIQVSGLREDQYVEGVTTNDDIYPRNLIKTSKVTSYEKDVEDESTPEEGDYIKRTFYRVNSLAIVNEDGEKTGDMAFRKAYILSGKNLHIVFQSGSLSGMNFECEFNPDGVSEILKDDDGNPILKDGKEQINPKSQVFEIVANEDYGRFLPDITLHPKDGDTFVLYNWDSTKLGDTLVSSASNELLTDAIKDLKKSMIDPTTYTCTAEANYSYNQGRGNLHGVGDRVNLYNKGYGDSYRASRIIGYEFCLDIPYDGAKYYVGEKPSYSRLNAMESKIEELVYNGQSYLNGNGGSGRSIYIIKSYDSITPTDYNVFSAKAVDEQRLNKTKDDTAKGTITWEKVQKLLSGLLVGNFNNENGGSWTPDTEGRSHLITDYLEVRMKAIFEELVIKKTSTIGGKEIISPAGGVVAHKVEEVTVTYNNVSQKAYRCYFLAEQEGDAVDNDFSVNDQVRSESFNVRKGTYHKVGNHFYWRLVIGRDEEPVELEGKKYHYIDLSDTDCATASDVPAKGDVLSQCGNRTDVERQNCLIFSAVDTYSPSVSLYHGINSYSFANKEYVEYGVNKQTNKAFFNVYGDMYVGDRPTKENGYEGSSYIKYDSAAKQVSIKGKLSAKSTVDGKELSQYIKENSAGGLTEEQVNNLIKNSQVIADLQNQVDGAIETWFYDGVPTLKNAPASSWTTDKEKDTHLGDLYYDNKTGKAYRFAKDGNTYKWTIITDTDIAKALSDASKAQETADGKMKVFSTQPIPPYQLGDIWVNATYPTDGSIYKNEILRCQTAKAKGSSFAIADWTKASKYTDDSALNTFKEEYKNDMASYKEQLDEKVETWFYNYAPTTQNKPASDWTTDTLKSQHAGDLFYNTSNGYTYRWTGTAWARIKDNDINTAMTAASKAQDTADGKRTVFTSQPTVPYDEGDLWASGGDDGKTLMVCVKSRATGSFTSSEWVKANDSDLNAFAKTIEESLTGIQDQLDKKAETWYQSTDPSTSWTTDDAKKKHKGDLWYNTSNNQTFFWNGTKWDKQDVPTEVFDKIDGKSSIYVSKPASYEERDLWILEAAYTLGGVAYSKGELVVATKSNASFSAADWTKKVKYTDDTVANAAKKAAEEAKKAADTAQTNVTNLGKTVTSNKKAFDNYVTDGYLEPSEIAAMAQDSKRLEDAFAAAQKSYNEVKEAEVLTNTNELTDLNTAFATLTTAKTELVKYLSDISKRYNETDTNGKATIVSAVGTKFTNFQSAYSAFYDKLGLANAYITSKIYGDLKQNITDLAGYKYIKDALGQTTDIDGGLVMTTLLALRDADGNVQSGINGAIDTNRGKKSIATWWGGQMVDKDYNSGSLTPATSLVRFDGSGYLANGAIWWDVDGKVHADPTSFIISEKNLGAYLAFFEPTWKSGSNGTNIKDLVALTPQAPFTTLSVSNDLLVEGKLKLGSITLSVVNGALKIDGNVYSTGGMSAYGDGTNNGGGGGLVASVKSYTDIIKGTYTDNDLASIPNAYAIKALSNRIDNISSELGGLSLDWANITGKPSTFTPSAHTHKWVDITDRITKVSQLTNDSGYTTNKGTVTSVKLTLPTGLSLGTTKEITTSGTFAISLTSGYSIPTTSKQGQWDSAYNWYKLMTTDEETADGVINKWNEVVDFLAGIAQTDSLDSILSGINKSITDETNRAKKAEGANATNIATNKANITTLQGYFTNGSAKSAIKLTNARKLWGNSFDGTADISGSIVVPSGKYITIGNIKLEYDATNKALKITNTTTNEVANFYATGGITAYGEGSGSSGGGGLNGSVKSYADALKLASESLSEIASAYSIKALDSRISSLEGGSATSIETTGSGNAVTSVSKSGTKITFTKGSTFSLNGHTHTFASLTSKPTSLSGYGITDGVNAVSVTGSGNAVTAASVSGHTLTLTKGSTFSLSNHTHYVGTTQVQGSSAEQALTGITKIDNILKLSKATVTVNTSYKAEQNRLVIYGNTYGNDANYIKSARKLSYGDGGPQLVFSTNENPDASGVQSAALVYTDHDTIGAGVSLSFVTNQGDAYFIAPHIKALTAFQGNLAWSYITNKPTTLSGFGITDGLRSVTHPSGSNVFVTGISTSGTAITYTKSYTKKSLSAVGTSGWTNASIDGNIIPDMSFIAYWNGAYSGTSSNLAYCNKGAFGSFAIKNSLAFSELTSKPTTISGYGITDAYTKSQVDAIAAKYLPLTGGTLTGQLKIVASALNGAYNGLLIGDDCYIGDCNFGNTIGLMGVGNNNAGMVKFGKGGMQFGYNGSNHIASTTAQWTNLNADLLDGWHKDNIVWSGAVNSNTASLSHYWAKLFDITVTGNQYDDRNFTFLFSNGYNDTYSVVVLRIRQNGAKDSGAYKFNISLRELVGNMSSRLRVYYNNATGNVQLWGNCQEQYGSLSYTIIKKTGRASADFTSQGTLVTNSSFSEAQSLPATTGDSPYTLLDGATRIGIVKQADQLVTARSLWGQSFNGTANVSGNMTGVGNINTSAAPAGTIYTNNWFRSKGSTGWYSEDHGGGWYMTDNTWIRSYGSKDVYLSNKLSVNGNVGIGTTAPSHKLHVLGEIYTTTKVNINGIILEKDSNGDLKVNGNLYATGGISAYGTSSAGSGGGLSGSVLAWDSAIKMPNATNGSSDTTKTESSFLASAWSIKQLYNKVTNLEGGSAMNVSVSGSGNAVTSISKSGTTISVVKGSTFLTAHQSLAGYMKTATADAKYMYHSRNNIVSDLNSFATNGAAHIYEMNNVTNRPNSNSWVQVMNWGTGDSSYGFLLANDYSTNGHMYFRQKIAGSWKDWKTIIDSSNIGSQSVNYAASAGSVAWTNVSGRPSTMKNPSALSWSGYSSGSYDGSAAKSISIPNNTNQLTNGAGFITASASITGNAATATKVNHSLSVFGKSFNGSADVTVADTDLIASISTATANLTDKTEILTSYASNNGFNDSNAKNRIHRRPASAIWGYINSKTISNADKLDNVHLNGIFTALSNTNNGVSMTIGTVAKSLANMQVYSATKLATARNIALGHDFRGSANFDGTGNITINGHINAAIIGLGPTDPSPFKRIAHVQVSGSWNDNALLLYLSQGYIGGFFGICRVEFRINDVSEAGSASASVKWLFRHGYATDYVQVGFYSAKHNSYMDVFVKTTGGYQGTVIRCLQDSRGSINSNVSLLKATETTEAYTSIEAAATALYKLAYTAIVKGSDAGAVNYANSAGNAGTLDGIHANGLFTNLSNNGNNLSITIGGTNKTLTVGYATKAAQLNTARTLWGQSFDGTGNVNGNMTGVGNINTSAAPAGTIYTNNWFRSKGSTGWYSEDHGGGWYMTDNTWIRSYGSKDVYLSNKLSVNGNVGIGTTAPSHKLHVLGEIYTTTKVNINGIILEKDSNGDLKVNGNLYATGGISAYGTSSAGSGGGLSGSVLAWDSAIKMPNATNGSSDTTKTESSFLASAWSIKQLYNKVTNLEGGSAMNVSVSGSGNAVTSISKSGTTISVVKGSTFLTAHQSLAGYMKTATADAKYMYHSRNNIVSDLNSFATNGAAHIYEMNNVTNRPNSNSWVQVMNWGTGDSSYGFLLANDYSTNGHMYFRQKIAGSWKDWKTIIDSSNIGSQSVNYAASAGSVAWTNVSGRPSTMKNPSALSWSGYSSGSYDGSAAKSISIPNNTNQLTNGAGFITASASITGNAATATKVNHSLSVFGKSFNGSADVTVADTDLIASISTATANLTDKTEILTSYASNNGFNDSNAKNRIHRRPASAIWGYINSKTISNADKLDNVHLNGIFTALSNTNNGVSMTIGTVAKSLANMQVYSATKLATARNIALGHDFRGSANFDGTGNITINGHINAAIIGLGPTDPSPFKRIAHVQVSGSWNDNALLLYLSQGYIGGFFGICRVEFRINDVSEAGSASASVKWLFRHGYATDYVQVGFYSAKHNSYMDVFVKTTGGYQGTVIRCLQDSRGSINSNVSLLKATETTEAYTSIEAAATALYKLAYTAIVKGSDAGAVNYANSAGNAGTLDGIHANGLFTNLSNNGNNLSITIGGTNKTLTVGYATKAAQLNTARTLWGQSFDGTGNVNGALSGATTISASNTISTTLQNGALKIGDKSTPISAIGVQVIFNTGGAIRFGETAWDWNQWAGLKYNHSSKTIYLGIADGSVFNANSAQSGGVINLKQGISSVYTPTLYAGGDIYHTGVYRMLWKNSKASKYLNVMTISQDDNGILTIGYGNFANNKDVVLEGYNLNFRVGNDSGMKSMWLNYNNGNPVLSLDGNFYATGGVTAYKSSDERLKHDIHGVDSLAIIKAMGGTVAFRYNADNKDSIGWIAQRVLHNTFMQDLVEKDDKGFLKINYWSPKLIAVAFGAIEQVDDEVSRLKARVVFLESEVQRLSGKQDGNNKKRLDNKNINLLN